MSRAAILVLALIACGDDAAPIDAGSDVALEAHVVDARDAGVVSVATPMPPRWDCPTGWLAHDLPAPHCAPPGDRVACAADEARFIDSTSCVPVGPCPAGEYADGLPTDGVLFVRSGATGRGTLGDPFGTIAEALAVARSGDTIALARGSYDEPITLPDGVAIVGACPGETHLRWSGIDASRPVVFVTAGDSARLEGVTIGPVGGVGIVANGALRLARVIVQQPVGAGILVTTIGSVSGEDVVVRGTTPRGGTSGGMGVIVDGGTLNASRWVVRDNVRNGVRIDGGNATLEDLVAIDNAGVEPLLQGSGVQLISGTMTLRRADLRGADNVALEVTGGVATAEDVFIDEATVVDPPGGTLLSVREGELSVTRAFVRGESWTVNGSNGALTLRDAVVVNDGDGFVWAENIGISTIGTRVELERVVVIGGDSGVVLSGPFDFSIDPEPRDPLETPTGFSLTDLDIRAPGEAVRFGYGLLLQEGMEGTVERAHVSMARGLGIDVDVSRVTASDLTVLDALAGGDLEGRPSFGRAITTDESFVTVTRALIARALEAGIEARGGTLDLIDVTIDETLERPCAETDCSDAPGGIGLGVYFDAVVSATNLRIYDAPLCGVQIAFDGALDLSGGEITGATVGACVQVEGYDVRRLTNGVAYDNTTNIESTAHAIPEAPPPPSL